MKKDIHSPIFKVTLNLPNGDKIDTFLTKDIKNINCDFNIGQHPAWGKSANAFVKSKNEKAQKLHKQYEDFVF